MFKSLVQLSIPDRPNLVFNVVSEQGIEGDMCRVSAILRSIWNRLDSDERGRLFTHYSSSRAKECPQIIIRSEWWWNRQSDANCQLSGWEINLNWLNVHHAPDPIIEILLAHELAHALQHATGKHRLDIRKEDLQGRIEVFSCDELGQENLVEIHADETIIGWGYRPLDYLIWMVKHTEVKDGKPRLRRKPLSDRNAERKATRIQDHTYFRSYN